MSNFFPLTVTEFARGVCRRGSPASLLCSERLLVVCSFGLVWFHTCPCPHRFPELSRPNACTAEPGESPDVGTARARWTPVVRACVRRSGHLLFSGALKISLGEGKRDAATLELAGPTLAFTSPLPSGDTGSVSPDLPTGHSPKAAPGAWPGWQRARLTGASRAAH